MCLFCIFIYRFSHTDAVLPITQLWNLIIISSHHRFRLYWRDKWIFIILCPLPESGWPSVSSWWRVVLRCIYYFFVIHGMLTPFMPHQYWSYLTVSIGSTYESYIPSDINHIGTLPRVNPMRRALNQAWHSLFPVDTSSSSYCFQRSCFTKQ